MLKALNACYFWLIIISFFAMETCIKEDTDYQRFYSDKVTSVGDVISMQVNTVILGTLVNFDKEYQLQKG